MSRAVRWNYYKNFMRDTDPAPVSYNGMNISVYRVKYAEWVERLRQASEEADTRAQARIAQIRADLAERLERIQAEREPPAPRIVERGLTPEINIPIDRAVFLPRLRGALADSFVMWVPVNGDEQTRRTTDYTELILPQIEAEARRYNGGIPTFHRVLIDEEGSAHYVRSSMTALRRRGEPVGSWFRRMWWMMYESTKKYKEKTYYAYIKFSPPPALPPLEGIRDGEINCVVKAVLDELKGVKGGKEPCPRTKSKIKRLEEMAEAIKDKGANMADFQAIAKISAFNLKTYDQLANTWHEFRTSEKSKNIMLTIHDGHAYAKKWEVPKIAKQDIVWKFCDVEKLFEFPMAKIMVSGEKITALITPQIIYKRPFPGYHEYPQCYSEAGIGKLKIQEILGKYYRSEVPVEALLDAVPKNIYIRNGQSKASNTKQDMNQAYRNHDQSPYYRGIPKSLTVYSYDTAEAHLAGKAGLVYITASREGNHNHFTEGINTWYALEVLDWVKECSCGCSFTATHVAIGEAIKPDYSNFTKDEFRKMVGRCASKESTEVWATSDKNEYEKALFSLQDRIIKHEIKESYNGEEGAVIYYESPLYFVYYRAERKPWALPIVPIIVKENHNIRLYSVLNELADQGIKPVAVKVDSIEVEAQHEKALMEAIKKVGGGWKAEGPKEGGGFFDHQEAEIVHALDIAPPPTYVPPPARPFVPTVALGKLTHIAGKAGNAKTQWIVDNFKNGALQNTLFCASTGKASRNLQRRMGAPPVATAHKLFGMGCRHTLPHPSTFDRVVIEEISMLGTESLEHIDRTLKAHCHSTQYFGGKDLVIVGDFQQLKPVKDIPFNQSALYELFEVIELMINYRQKDDPALYLMCEWVRNPMTEEFAEGMIKCFNKRFYKGGELPTNSTLDDVYIAGTNREVDRYNTTYPFAVGNKAMLRKTMGDYRNGDEGIITAIQNEKITLTFADGGHITAKPGDGQIDRPTITASQGQTVHLCQGDTKKGNVIINPSNLFEENHLYVALTRATHSKNITFSHPITLGTLRRTCHILDEYDGEDFGDGDPN